MNGIRKSATIEGEGWVGWLLLLFGAAKPQRNCGE